MLVTRRRPRNCNEPHSVADPPPPDCRVVEGIVLPKGRSALVYAWSWARAMLEELLRGRAEEVAVGVNGIGILARGLREDVELDPATVWYVRVYGVGVYQPYVLKLCGRVEVLYVCFYNQ